MRPLMNPAFVKALSDGGGGGGDFGPWEGLSFQHDNPVNPETTCYMNIGNADGFDGETAMTWSFWFKSDGYQGAPNRERIYIRYWDSDDCEQICVDNDDGAANPGTYLYVRIADDAAHRWDGWLDFTDAGVSVGEWFHVLVTYDGGTSSCKIYINSTEKVWSRSVGTLPAQLSVSPNSHFIGGSAGAIENTWSFKGDISQFRIFTEVVDAATINTLYNGGAGKQDHHVNAKLEMEYLFEDNELANNVADTSGNGLDYSTTKTTPDPHWVNSTD